MKIRVYVSSSNTYNAYVLDTDNLPILNDRFHLEKLPSIFIDDLINDLIDSN